MDSGQAISIAGLIIAFLLLAYCSLLDWRTRKVPNTYWIILSTIGVILLIARILADDANLEYLLVLVPIVAVLSDVYLEGEGDTLLVRAAPIAKYLVAIFSVAALAILWGEDRYFQHYLAVPIVMMVMVVFYMANVIRGGADAKALISLAIMFPFYPDLSDLPLIEPGTIDVANYFPFTLTVLLNAAILVAFLPLAFLVMNLAAHEFEFPQGFLGYKLNKDQIVGKHVWLMERAQNGVASKYVTPKAEEDLAKEVDLLVKAGKTRIWVTPKLPFIVPITVSLIFSAVVGGLLFLLV